LQIAIALLCSGTGYCSCKLTESHRDQKIKGLSWQR